MGEEERDGRVKRNMPIPSDGDLPDSSEEDGVQGPFPHNSGCFQEMFGVSNNKGVLRRKAKRALASHFIKPQPACLAAFSFG